MGRRRGQPRAVILDDLTVEEQRRLDAWLLELDHPGPRLEAAQAALAGPPGSWPPPPGDPEPEPVVPVPARLGAYARRAAQKTAQKAAEKGGRTG